MSLNEKIMDAKRKLGDSAALLIAEELNIEQFDENKLVGLCPFHEEKTPSFRWNPNDFAFKCFGCPARFGILDLYIKTEGNFQKALKRLFSEAEITHTASDIEINKPDKEFFENYKYPYEETNTDRSIVNSYAKNRCISESTLDYAGIKQDKHGNVVFEMRDADDTLVAVKYRVSRPFNKGDKGFKWWWQPNYDNCPMLFNSSKIDTSQPLVITEGYFDTLAIIEAGYKNVVSIHGGAEDLKWIEFNYELLNNCEQIILWFDNDTSGNGGLQKAISRLGEYRCRIIKPTKEYEEKVKQYYKKAGSKRDIIKTDANNILVACGKEEIIKLILEAEEIPSKKLKYLMDCKTVSMKDIEKVSTGLKALDKLIYGNLFPCFSIYSGYAGSGKTSIANIASIIAPVDNGYKTFVFSGELAEGQLTDWIINPLAGYNHIEQTIQKGIERPFYSVTSQAQTAIRSFYRKKMIIFSDNEGLTVSGEELIKEMEYAYKKYGCRVFLIDNLMCLTFDGSSEDSKWELQKKFIISLMGFSNKYNCNVNLVAHPKKPSQFGKEATVYDVSGASEIANLCHRMFWVKRLKPEESPFNVRIEVIKDRPSGASGGCDLYYDEKTKRVYSTLDELKHQYEWEREFKYNYGDFIKNQLVLKDFPRFLPHEDTNNMPY